MHMPHPLPRQNSSTHPGGGVQTNEPSGLTVRVPVGSPFSSTGPVLDLMVMGLPVGELSFPRMPAGMGQGAPAGQVYWSSTATGGGGGMKMLTTAVGWSPDTSSVISAGVRQGCRGWIGTTKRGCSVLAGVAHGGRM